MPRVRTAAAALALLTACSSPVRVPVVEGAQSAILAVESDGRIRAFAQDLVTGEDARAVPIDDETERLTFLAHRRTLAQLQLAPGELVRVDDLDRSRPLPFADEIHIADAPFERWTTAPAPGERSAAFRVARESVETCVQRGGCLVGDVEEALCEVCPAPSAVAEPSFATVPDQPVLTPCAPGWRPRPVRNEGVSVDVAAREVTVCDPDAGLPPSCASGLALPGGDRCQRIGPDCPAGEWAALSGAVVYVRAGASGPAPAGTPAAPWASLDEALASARASPGGGVGATIALAAGRYTASRPVPDAVRIVGACVERTELALTVELTGGAAVAGLRITTPLTASGALALDGVSVEAPLTARAGTVSVRGSALTTTVTVEGGTLTAAGSALARLVVGPSATASVSASRVDAVSGGAQSTLHVARSIVGPIELSGADATLTDVATRGRLGARGGSVTLVRAWVRGTIATDDGAIVDARDLVVEAMPAADGLTLRGTRATLTRLFVAGASGAGLFMDDAGGIPRLTARDLTILSVRPRSGSDAQGIFTRGGEVDAQRLLIEDALGPGITADGTTGEVRLADLRMLSCGDGLRVGGTRAVVAERLDLDRIRGAGVIVGENAGAPSLVLSDARIVGTRTPFCMDRNCSIAGLTVRGGSLRATRLAIARSEDLGLRLGSLDVWIEDASIDDNETAIQVEVPGLDLDRVLGRVSYRGNGQLIRRVTP